MDSITLNAYAKINLYLDVLFKMDNGYHFLETVMHNISLCDIVTIEVTKSDNVINITCSDPEIPLGKDNIAYKCADWFFSRSCIDSRGVNIHIEKHIPSQAGMGGGSADGAAVLNGMNTLFGGVIPEHDLYAIGSWLGADIPFCMKSGISCGFCSDTGSVIEELPPFSGTVLIGKGKEGISTKEAFSKIDSLDKKLGMKDVRDAFAAAKSFHDILPYCRNLFDEVTELDEVRDIKEIMLSGGAAASCMTGSGSAVFGLYDDADLAEKTALELKNKGYFSSVCSFI